jgi:hypothetical protein
VAAPINNNGGRKSDKMWRDALMVSAKRTQAEAETLALDNGAPLIHRAAAQVMLKAAAGDKDAYKEVGDRIDGKPHVSMDVTTIRDVSKLQDEDLYSIIRAGGGGDGDSEAPKDKRVTH